MSATVKQVLECLDAIAPFALAEEWDNVGLLVGNPDAAVDCIMCALDLNVQVVEEAVRSGAQLIVTHHPVMFRGRKNLREDDPEGKVLCALIRSGIAHIAMHTNFDNADPGINTELCKKLGIENIRALDCGVRMGEIGEMRFSDFAAFVQAKLGGPVRRYGDPDRSVRSVAVLGGAGEDFAMIARANGADVYLTGEMAYHKALDCEAMGLNILEAGHAATELPGVNLLCRGLQNALDEVQYKIRVLESKSGLFL